MTADVAVGLLCALAGITLFSGVACAGIWLSDRSRRVFLTLVLLAVVVSATLVAGAAVVSKTSPTLTAVAVAVRGIGFGVAAIIAVLAAGQAMPSLRVRSIVRAMTALLVVRSTVALSTDLVSRPVLADGWPSYGPLGPTNVAFAVAMVVVGAMAFRRPGLKLRVVITVSGLGFAATILAGGLLGSHLARELTLSLSVLPGAVGTLGLAASALMRNDRARAGLARQQRTLALVSQAALTMPVDTLRRVAERELRSALGRDDVVVLVRNPGDGNGAAAAGSELGVDGRRQQAVARGLGTLSPRRREFVESVLRVVVTVADRASVDADYANSAVHDAETGLPNGVLLRSRLEDRLQERSGRPVLLVLCRVDGLGRLAAVDGTSRSYDVVASAARALESIRRPGTTVARATSDTFAVVEYLPENDPDGFLVQRLREVRRTVALAVGRAGSVRVGAVSARDDADAESMLRDALVTLERTHGDGDDSGIAVFDEEHAAALRDRVALERALADAVANDEIEVRYQPVVDTGTRTVVGCEALARWRRDGGIMPPARWVPLAEATGLIHDIGRRVLRIAAADQARLGVPVAVNVSPLELAAENFVADVLDSLGDCPPRLVTLEVTESAVMADVAHSVALIEELHAHGLRIALDDFGTSHSSLAVLVDLPVDVLKLDRSFVTRLDTPNGVAVVEAIAALGRALGKPIIAEGVETEAQYALLAGMGVERVQGFLVGRPVRADRLRAGRLRRPAPRHYSSSVR